MPSIIAAGIGAAASIGGALISSNSAQSAANTQAQAADQASAAQLQMFQQIRTDLSPYRDIGSAAANPLMYGLGIGGTEPTGGPLAGTASGSLLAPFNPDMATLAATPGYQFTRQQGLESTQNSFAAQGLGASGAAAKGAANYAENLASTTYQQQFNNYWAQKQTQLNALTGAVGTGQSAANQTGAFGTAATQSSNNFLTSGAAATAAGQVGSANALTGGLGGLNNSALLYSLGQSGMFGGGGSGTSPSSLNALAFTGPSATNFAFGASPSNFSF